MNPAIPPSRRRLAPLLAGLSMLGPFSIDTMFPAFPAMAAQLHASPLAMQQTISVYLIAYAAMSLLHGPLSDALGRRPVILGGIALFILATIGCALSGSIASLLVFRALQGVFAGAGMIVGRAIIRDCFHGAEAQRLMSTVSMIFGVAPALAPIVGGWVIAVAQWPVIFWLLAAFAALLLIASSWLLPETLTPAQRQPLSLSAMAASYGAILRDRQFFPLALAGTLNFNALFLYIASAPAFVLNLLRLGEQDFIWLFGPAIGGLMLGSYLSGRMAGRMTARRTIAIGYSLILGASALNLGVAVLLDQPQVPWSVLPISLHAIGIGICFPTLTLMLLDRHPRHRGAVSSLQAFISLVISAVLAGAISPLLSDSALKLAAGAALFSALGFANWTLVRRRIGMAV